MLTVLLSFLLTVNKPEVHLVGNAHFDSQWRWTAKESVGVFLHNTLVQNFALFERYPDYVLNFEGAVKYEWAKEYYPDLYQRLKSFVALGRWNPCGSCYDANDTNVPCPESAFRNIYYAQRFFRSEFGISTADIMLPDCFGFSATLPTIASHCGIRAFSTQKLSWRETAFPGYDTRYPFEYGVWRGIDGSAVRAVLDGGGYAWCPSGKPGDMDRVGTKLAAYPVNGCFLYYGTRSSQNKGDRGGSVLPMSLRYLTSMAERTDLPYALKFSRVTDFFDTFADESVLPSFSGELLMDVHGTGCYTSRALMKRLNRTGEQSLLAAEAASTAASVLGLLPYPEYTLTQCWKRLLLHQFHDDLTGTSIDKAYEISYRDEYLTISQARRITRGALEAIAAVMDTRRAREPVIVFNPTSSVNRSLVELPDGKGLVPCICPPMSVMVADAAARPKTDNPVILGERFIENGIYRVKIDENGDICSILDKRCGKELVRDGSPFGLAVFENNVSLKWPAWEIRKSTLDAEPSVVSDEVTVSSGRRGPNCAFLMVEKRFGESRFLQRIVLTDGAADDRIDIENEVDWKSCGCLLKAVFPTSIPHARACYDLGLGHIFRGVNTDAMYEVPSQCWADLSEEDYGVTILSDCKYGWDHPDSSTLRLTLLHTPVAGEKFSYQSGLDTGHHSFTYSIAGHPGPADYACIEQHKAELCGTKTCIYAGGRHKGSRGVLYTLCGSSNDCIPVKSVMMEGDDVLMRTYELSGRGASTLLSAGFDHSALYETNGVGDSLAAVPSGGLAARMASSAFQPRSFRFKDAAVAPDTRFIEAELPFNTVSITSDSFTALGKMDNNWHSFAAEIIPDTLVWRGVPFRIGEADYPNSVRCSGQRISLPEGAQKVYVLAASMKGNRKAEFTVGGKPYLATVPCYSQRILCEVPEEWPDIAYVGTHRHDSMVFNEPFEYTYLYFLEIPCDGSSELVLPDGDGVVVFSITIQLHK